VSPDTTDLISQASAWVMQDPDSATANELAAMVTLAEAGDADATADLADRFSGHLTFGTAGLRGEIGAGPMRMNRVVVSHAAHGLGRYLLDRQTPDSDVSVVIGYDARTLSDVFARDTAHILSGMGIRALLCDAHVPTPVLAFAVRHFDADAGVMVTASHNPPADNGYKVYLGGSDRGSQIIPPADAEIHAQIMASHDTVAANAIARSDSTVEMIGAEVVDAYVQQTATLLPPAEADRSALRLCYTPLHGVGRDVFVKLLDHTGFPRPTLVASQENPDPTFPTVSFPNPEEPGALDEAYATAREHHCDLIIAHDPDADRLAVATPDSGSRSGWSMMSGNDLGVLLLADIAERASAAGVSGSLACSVVSTPMIGQIAARNGLRFVSTPTGFKWISRPDDLLAGFEEAIGYLVNPDTVRDKDGISAGLALYDLALRLHARGMSLTDRLAEIAASYGGWASDTISSRLGSVAEVSHLMTRVRNNPAALLGDIDMTIVDYLVTPPEGFPRTDLITAADSHGGRVIIRPSGTEPKLKIYIDALAPDHNQAKHAVNKLSTSCRDRLSELSGVGGGE
jgi:phosphomannomutase